MFPKMIEANLDETIKMVRNLLQEDYVQLIERLPNDYFRLPNRQKRAIFVEIYHAINQGQRDITKLVGIAQMHLVKNTIAR
jgi:hypothetical protein